MDYELAAICDVTDGHLMGFVIKKVGLPKLESINIYNGAEFNDAEEQVRYLNEVTALKSFWPMPTDPAVQALLDDPAFEPVQYDIVEVPDLENSHVVYDMKPGPQIDTDPTGHPVFGEDEVKYDIEGKPSINYRASVIAYKTDRIPRNTDARSRIDKACEIVARNYMEATTP